MHERPLVAILTDSVADANEWLRSRQGVAINERHGTLLHRHTFCYYVICVRGAELRGLKLIDWIALRGVSKDLIDMAKACTRTTQAWFDELNQRAVAPAPKRVATTLRMPPALHSRLQAAAARDGVTLNEYITRRLRAHG